MHIRHDTSHVELGLCFLKANKLLKSFRSRRSGAAVCVFLKFCIKSQV